MYFVLNNGKPADNLGFPEMAGDGWDCSVFDNLPDAQKYLSAWLGAMRRLDTQDLPVGERLIYNQGGDWVMIIRQANLADRDADLKTHSGRLRNIAWHAQRSLAAQGTTIAPFDLGSQLWRTGRADLPHNIAPRHIVTDLLSIADEIGAGK